MGRCAGEIRSLASANDTRLESQRKNGSERGGTSVSYTHLDVYKRQEYEDGTARAAAELMAEQGLATLPIVERGSQRVCGTVSLSDLLRGRGRSIEREKERLRLFGYVPPEEGGHN